MGQCISVQTEYCEEECIALNLDGDCEEKMTGQLVKAGKCDKPRKKEKVKKDKKVRIVKNETKTVKTTAIKGSKVEQCSVSVEVIISPTNKTTAPVTKNLKSLSPKPIKQSENKLTLTSGIKSSGSHNINQRNISQNFLATRDIRGLQESWCTVKTVDLPSAGNFLRQATVRQSWTAKVKEDSLSTKLEAGVFPKIDSLFNSNDWVKERTVNVETKKVQKDGKWVEEIVKTTTLTDEKGTSTKSHRPHSSPIRHKALEPLKEAVKEPSKDSQISVNNNKTSNFTKKNDPKQREQQETFAKEVLEATNGYRIVHGVPSLTLSSKLNKMALEWAERLAKMEKMEHGDKKNLGENIYCKTSSQPWFEMSGAEVVENWYNEVEEHDYKEEPNQGYLKTGHFTQLIWSDTKEMGTAFARNQNGHMSFVVAYFSPKGNWMGDFREKVPPPGGFAASKINNRSQKSTAIGRKTLPPINNSTRKSRSTPSSPVNSKLKNKTFNLRGSRRNRNSSASPTNSRPSTATDTPPSPVTKKFRNQKGLSSATSEDSSENSANTRSKITRPPPYPSQKTQKVENPTRPSYLSKNASTNASSTMTEEFKKDFLEAHNEYRKLHGVKPLRFSNTLHKYAQEWADTLAKKDRMEHREDNEYGENIYMKWSSDESQVVPGFEPVESWYSEIGDYEFGTEPVDLGAGHFTQLIWAETAEVGVGMAKSKSGKIYVVADYNPPGNYVGQFSRMVPPPKHNKK